MQVSPIVANPPTLDPQRGAAPVPQTGQSNAHSATTNTKAAVQPDRIVRSELTTNLNAYHDAIAKLSATIASDSMSTPSADPWGLAAGAVGGALGAVLGAGTSGAAGGAAGTFVEPGVGTVAGAAAGGAEGAVIGGAAGAAIGYGVGSVAHDMVHMMNGSSATPGPGDSGETRSRGVKAVPKP